MKRCLSRLLFSLLCLLLLPGCWDRTEINDMAFVLVSALDLEPDGKYRYSVMVPLPGQMGGATGGGGGTAGEKSYYVDSDVGVTVREAMTRLQHRMSRRLFLAHRRTILIGEPLARKDITGLFDQTPRNPESRMTTYLIVTKGPAYEMLQTNPRFERFPSEAIRELAKSPSTTSMNVKDFGLALSIPGSDPVSIYMSVTSTQKSEKPSKEVELKGYAQFKKGKMIGTYEDEAAQGLTWLRSQRFTTTVTIPVEDQHIVTLRLFEPKTSVKVNLDNGKLHYIFHVKTKAKLAESRSTYDLSQSRNILKIEQAASEYVKKSMQTAIDRIVKNQTDSAQLGALVWRSHPNEWKKTFEADWPQGLRNAEFKLSAETELSDPGLIYDNVIKGETLP